jgi:SAM-dependent methyltransferase
VAISSPSTSQHWSPDTYVANADFVPALGQPVLDLLRPQSGERILDLGCGDGSLTEKLVVVGAQVVGIDGSPEMIAAARQRGLEAKVMDARSLAFENEFDAVFSNAVLHWIRDDPDAPIAGAFRALRAGGRFVGELGGHANVAAITVALVATLERRGIRKAASWIPWYFPTVEDYETRLRRACAAKCTTAPAPHAAADRNARVARHIRQSVLRRAALRGTRQLSRRGYGSPQASPVRCERALDGGLCSASLCCCQTLKHLSA